MALKRVLLRRDTAANWTTYNPTLSQGELGLEFDTKKLKIGDGITPWIALEYFKSDVDINDPDLIEKIEDLIGTKVIAGTNTSIVYDDVAGTTTVNAIGDLTKAGNLSGLADYATARTNLGLGSVDNTADLDKPISTLTQTALDSKANQSTTYTKTETNTLLDGKLDDSQKGVANGLAELGADGKVLTTQLPSYVDDILEYDNLAGFPTSGEAGKIYVTKDTNLTYRWSGSIYVEISESLALGETSSTAYRGDRGKTAYDHTSLTNNPHSVDKTQVGLGNVDNTTDLNKPISTATQTALDTKVVKVISGDNAIVRFDGTSGEVQNSGAIINDNGNLLIGDSTDNGAKLQVNGNATVNGSINSNGQQYGTWVETIQTSNGGQQNVRVVEDCFGRWLVVGKFASDASVSVASLISTVRGLSTSTAQNDATNFSADFGNSYPTEVRFMGATDFTRWKDTRTIDWVYKVPANKLWKDFFVPTNNTRWGFAVAGAYDGFGRWNNPAMNFMKMSDDEYTNPADAYINPTANAINFTGAGDAKFVVIHNAAAGGQDDIETSAFGYDDGGNNFFDAYPNVYNNMSGTKMYTSAVWIMIKLN